MPKNIEHGIRRKLPIYFAGERELNILYALEYVLHLSSK